jgi:ribosomal RNA-processing protein 8
MGNDVTSFFVQASRVLKVGGELVVAEVKSRFVDAEAEVALTGMKKGLRSFQAQLEAMGFSLLECDSKTNSMFVLMRFKKEETMQEGTKAKITLKNCPYKRR